MQRLYQGNAPVAMTEAVNTSVGYAARTFPAADGTHGAPNRTDPPGEMVQLLGVTAQPAIDAMLDTIRAMLDTASDLPEAMRNLEALFPEMDDAALADILAQAFLAANLAGRQGV